MMMNKEYVVAFAKKLLAIDSPTGYTKKAIDFVEEEAKRFGYQTKRNHKGNLWIYVKGNHHHKTLGLCAHCDTLGLMVRSIKSDGKLALTNLGGPIIPTLDGEYCRIYTRDGQCYSGTILSTSPAAHVYKDASTKKREIDEMEVRIDEVTYTKEDTQKLGIQNGDIVAIDPKVQITESGFIKSRFLDDKISVSALMGILHHLKENAITPAYDLIFMMSTYEEVGHGMAHIPDEIAELLHAQNKMFPSAPKIPVVLMIMILPANLLSWLNVKPYLMQLIFIHNMVQMSVPQEMPEMISKGH